MKIYIYLLYLWHVITGYFWWGVGILTCSRNKFVIDRIQKYSNGTSVLHIKYCNSYYIIGKIGHDIDPTKLYKLLKTYKITVSDYLSGHDIDIRLLALCTHHITHDYKLCNGICMLWLDAHDPCTLVNIDTGKEITITPDSGEFIRI